MAHSLTLGGTHGGGEMLVGKVRGHGGVEVMTGEKRGIARRFG